MRFAGEGTNQVNIPPARSKLLPNELICCAVENIHEKVFMAEPAVLRYTQILEHGTAFKAAIEELFTETNGS